jgi:hypothetical protein
MQIPKKLILLEKDLLKKKYLTLKEKQMLNTLKRKRIKKELNEPSKTEFKHFPSSVRE